MRLNSFSFLVFSGLLLLVYYRVPKQNQWCVLLAGSCLFYLASGMEYLLFLLFTILTVYAATSAMARNFAARESILPQLDPAQRKALKLLIRKRNRGLLALCLTANFAMLLLCKVCLLGFFKNSPFSFLTLGLPLGISFYCFQSMGYVMDVYRESVEAEKSIFKLSLFIAYFPLLIQGPICRYRDLSPQLQAGHSYDPKQVSFGLQRMLWGYFKKLVIADRINLAVTALRGPECTGAAFGLLTLFYAVQLYGDFTGGIDIVLGFSQSLGISLPENFIRPFFSKSIAEYWRRWHISLGAWMKDYLFYPVSVSGPLRRLSKAARQKWPKFGKRLPVYIASCITWLATGLWHGLTPNFVLWGMLNCLVIVISEELTPLYTRFHERFHWNRHSWYDGFQMLRTFCLMNLIRACDLFPNPMDYFGRIFSLFSDFSIIPPGELLNLGLSPLDYGILFCGTALMAAVSILQEAGISLRQMLWKQSVLLRYSVNFFLFLAVLLMGSYGIGYEAGYFIYNQF